VDNTELFGWMTHALRIDHRNPPMTEAAALRRLASDELLKTEEAAAP
jgi:hypothetical protein